MLFFGAGNLIFPPFIGIRGANGSAGHSSGFLSLLYLRLFRGADGVESGETVY